LDATLTGVLISVDSTQVRHARKKGYRTREAVGRRDGGQGQELRGPGRGEDFLDSSAAGGFRMRILSGMLKAAKIGFSTSKLSVKIHDGE
jgi:hypothetical protein